MRVVFAGTPDFAVPTLQALIQSEHEIVAVLSQPDRPSGRGLKLRPSPVKALAMANKLPVITPENLRKGNSQDVIDLLSENVDVMVVVAYGLIIPESILSAPRFGCVNIHPSKLPLWRGAAPIQYSILSANEKTAMTIIQMDKGMDTGDILYQCDVLMEPGETASELHDRMASLGASCLLQTLQQMLTGQQQSIVQDHSRATYSKKMSKQDARIDWQLSAEEIVLRVRAYNAWPVAFTYLEDMRLRVWRAELLKTTVVADPGVVVGFSAKGLDVATGAGVVRITECQRPGGKVLPINDFFNSAQATWLVGESRLV
jgi:methionyl-tRNA formyltransferase